MLCRCHVHSILTVGKLQSISVSAVFKHSNLWHYCIPMNSTLVKRRGTRSLSLSLSYCALIHTCYDCRLCLRESITVNMQQRQNFKPLQMHMKLPLGHRYITFLRCIPTILLLCNFLGVICISESFPYSFFVFVLFFWGCCVGFCRTVKR